MHYQFLKSLFYCNALGFLFWMMLLLFRMLPGKSPGPKSSKPIPFLALLMILYFSSVIAITLVPLPFSTYRGASEADLNFTPVVRSVRIFLYPFKHHRMALLPDILENLVGNVLMFIPLGFLLPRAIRWFGKWYRVMLAAIIFSCGIEAAQWIWRYFGNYRHVDIDDVILNSLGAMIGYVFFQLFKKSKKLFTRQNQQMVPSPAGC